MAQPYPCADFMEMLIRLGDKHEHEVLQLHAEVSRLRAANSALVTVAAQYARENKALRAIRESDSDLPAPHPRSQSSDEAVRKSRPAPLSMAVICPRAAPLSMAVSPVADVDLSAAWPLIDSRLTSAASAQGAKAHSSIIDENGPSPLMSGNESCPTSCNEDGTPRRRSRRNTWSPSALRRAMLHVSAPPFPAAAAITQNAQEFLRSQSTQNIVNEEEAAPATVGLPQSECRQLRTEACDPPEPRPSPITSPPPPAPSRGAGSPPFTEPTWEWEATGASVETADESHNFVGQSAMRHVDAQAVGDGMERENHCENLEELAAAAAKPDESALEAALGIVALISEDVDVMDALDKRTKRERKGAAKSKDSQESGLMPSLAMTFAKCMEKQNMSSAASIQRPRGDQSLDSATSDLAFLAHMTDLLEEHKLGSQATRQAAIDKQKGRGIRAAGPRPQGHGAPAGPRPAASLPPTPFDDVPAKDAECDSFSVGGLPVRPAQPSTSAPAAQLLRDVASLFTLPSSKPSGEPAVQKRHPRADSATDFVSFMRASMGGGGPADPTQEWRTLLKEKGKRWRPDGDDGTSIGMYLDPPEARVKNETDASNAPAAGAAAPTAAATIALATGPGMKPICGIDSTTSVVPGDAGSASGTPDVSENSAPNVGSDAVDEFQV